MQPCRAKKLHTDVGYRPLMGKVAAWSLEAWQFSKAAIYADVGLGGEQFKLKFHVIAQVGQRAASVVTGRAGVLLRVV